MDLMFQLIGNKAMEDHFTNMANSIREHVKKSIYHRQRLAEIMLGDISSEQKLLELRKSIIVHNNSHDFIITPDKAINYNEPNINISFLTPTELEEFSDKLEACKDILTSLAKPWKDHQKLLKDIANILRTEDITAEKKMDQILNLMM